VAERIRVLLLIPRLNAGGAEQVMSLVATGLSQSKYEVHLALVKAHEAGSTSLTPSVTVHALGARRARTAFRPLLRLVWRLRPAVILSGSPEISFVVLALRSLFPRKTRVLVRQNGTVSAALSLGGVPRYTRWLYRFLYPRADRIICQSRAMAADLAVQLNIGSDRIAVLPNPVDLEGVLRAEPSKLFWMGPGPHLLAVGRLSPEKGFDLLVDAFAAVRRRYPHADLAIAGAGREESKLKSQCSELGLQTAVRFLGRVDKPYGLFAGATLFVLSSRYEGVPNSLLEAAAAGLPLVATPASGGVVDLLRGREGAWLAADISAESLAQALVQALETLRPSQRFSYDFFPTTEQSLESCCQTHRRVSFE
jgi:glycosyltransferase involved in cell wall biosynthesis